MAQVATDDYRYIGGRSSAIRGAQGRCFQCLHIIQSRSIVTALGTFCPVENFVPPVSRITLTFILLLSATARTGLSDRPRPRVI